MLMKYYFKINIFWDVIPCKKNVCYTNDAAFKYETKSEIIFINFSNVVIRISE
jgi:hypothetical protein